MSETKVTYLPDGAVVVVFPSNLTIALESGGNPVLENQHRMHFKRKIIAPNKLVHRIEWRFFLRRKGRPKESVQKLGRRLRVGEVFTRHDSMRDSHEEGRFKEKALLVCEQSYACELVCPMYFTGNETLSHLRGTSFSDFEIQYKYLCLGSIFINCYVIYNLI